jgi:hypothetical protein
MEATSNEISSGYHNDVLSDVSRLSASKLWVSSRMNQ